MDIGSVSHYMLKWRAVPALTTRVFGLLADNLGVALEERVEQVPAYAAQ